MKLHARDRYEDILDSDMYSIGNSIRRIRIRQLNLESAIHTTKAKTRRNYRVEKIKASRQSCVANIEKVHLPPTLLWTMRSHGLWRSPMCSLASAHTSSRVVLVCDLCCM